MVNPLGNLFGPSPIRPLQKHIQKAHSCAALLLDFYQATLTEDWKKAEQVQQQIAEAENEADKMKRDIRINLPTSLLLPFPRTDILEMLTMQDMLANHSKDIAGLMLGRKMQTPVLLAPSMQKYLQASIDTSAQALKAINELDELVETGFRGKEAAFVSKLIEELDRIEHHSDELQIEVRKQLFGIEKDLPPIDVIFFYKIIDRIGELADYAQRVGHRLMLLIAR